MVAWLIIFMVFVFWEVLALNFFAFSERRRMHLRTRSSNACSEWVMDGEEELRQLLKRVWSVVQSSREHAPRPPHTTKLWFLYLSATSFSVPTFMWVINHLDIWSAILIPSWLKKKKQKLNPKSCIWIFGILLHSVGVSIFTIRWRNYDVFPCHVFWLHIAYDLVPYNITVHHHLSGTARSI